ASVHTTLTRDTTKAERTSLAGVRSTAQTSGRRSASCRPDFPAHRVSGYRFGRERDAELIGDRDCHHALLQRGPHRLRREHDEPAKVDAAPDDLDLDAAGRKQEVGVRGDERRVLERTVDPEPRELALGRSALEHAVDQPEQPDELGAYG